MFIVSILAVLSFSITLCIVEIPKMLKENLHRELWTFSILLALGTVLAILKSLNVKIPNPSDFIAWVYSPLTNIIKSLLE
ncbi:hypothetical protein [Clostridium sp. AWRP]|uniref:hypothetical protein n=1 Tax=Clostridium sp. AWRP TaxID=2212991 RepID=UPI000FDC81A7|nr:hypothetical protein [Clostridium sp. AWRP]AZV58586.1 hypothetical protein DMR38_19470 [Clostridium sp. AWRP]